MNHREIAGLMAAIAPTIGDFVGKAMKPLRDENERLSAGLAECQKDLDACRNGLESILLGKQNDNVVFIGMIKEEVEFMGPNPTMTREDATLAARTFIVPEDMGTPPGALSLRGATNFQTPAGWDTVYTPIFNMIDRPVAPMLVVRVETDWYAHETEFRYVLEPGEGISGSHTMPIGQVVFVPREETTFRDCTQAELDAIKESQAQFSRDKAAARISTPYGMPYSPHYLRQSRAPKPKA